MMEEAELETQRNENKIIYFIELCCVVLPRESILMLGLDLRFLFNFETPQIYFMKL